MASLHLASDLAAAGFRRGDRVGVYLGNSPEAVISIFGAVAAGGCFVVINPTIKEDKLRHILADSGARFLITVPNTQARAARACATRDAVAREHFSEFAG